MKAVRVEREGCYLRVSHQGQLVLDACPSDPEHLVDPKSSDMERPTCRQLLQNLVPAGWLGKRGKWHITIAFEEDK